MCSPLLSLRRMLMPREWIDLEELRKEHWNKQMTKLEELRAAVESAYNVYDETREAYRLELSKQ
jgi:uncharacterized protein YeaO (DUF488 family)